MFQDKNKAKKTYKLSALDNYSDIPPIIKKLVTRLIGRVQFVDTLKSFQVITLQLCI